MFCTFLCFHSFKGVAERKGNLSRDFHKRWQWCEVDIKGVFYVILIYGSKNLSEFFLGIIHHCVSEGGNKDLRGTGAELQILESPTGIELADIFVIYNFFLG